MNPQTEISVVIPAYNAASFIQFTLATVLAQTILPYEVIVIDDGSLDKTCAVVESFASSNPSIQIRLLSRPHLGPGAARNVGIQIAKGSWIAFLDSDDQWKPTKLECMARAFLLNPTVNFLCHNEVHQRLDGSCSILEYSKDYREESSLIEQLYVRNRFSTSAIICRRDIILAYGGFDETLPNGQDYELWLRMSPKLKVLFVSDVLGSYLDRQGNISSGPALRRLFNLLRILNRHRSKVNKMTYISTVCRHIISYSYRNTMKALKHVWTRHHF